MQLMQGIQRLGFRKWYERELLQSHAHLALTFLCAVGLFGAFEAAAQFRDMSSQIFNALAILLTAAVGIWALRRYLALLTHAEFVANQADCPQCGVYARFKLADAVPNDDGVTVRCRECQHQWAISD
jgi:hypothetical protein